MALLEGLASHSIVVETAFFQNYPVSFAAKSIFYICSVSRGAVKLRPIFPVQVRRGPAHHSVPELQARRQHVWRGLWGAESPVHTEVIGCMPCGMNTLSWGSSRSHNIMRGALQLSFYYFSLLSTNKSKHAVSGRCVNYRG